MMKYFLSCISLLITVGVFGQVQTQLVGDSVRIRNNTGTSELILENSTKNINGFLYNKGNGRTEFRKGVVKLSDTSFIIGGDTLRTSPASNAAGNLALQNLTDGTTITWNVNSGINATVTLGATNRILTLTNPVAGQTYRLKVVQDGTGNRTIGTWPSGILWPSGTPPVLSNGAGSIDMLTFYYDGTSYYGSYHTLYKAYADVDIASYDTKTNSSATVHTLGSVPPGALLVIATGGANSLTNANIISSPALTWTKQTDAAALYSGDAEIYTAVFTAGGAITVTSDWGSGVAQASVCYTIINQEVTLSGATATGNTQTQPSVTLTTTKANSIIIGITTDFNAVGTTRTYRDTPSETYYQHSPGEVTIYHYFKKVPTATSTTLGLTAPNTQKGGTALLEIRGR